MCPSSNLSPTQRHLVREILFLGYEFGFHRAYSLEWLARHTGMAARDLYDPARRRGLLWDLGEAGEGFLRVAPGAFPGSGQLTVLPSKLDRLAYLTDFGHA